MKEKRDKPKATPATSYTPIFMCMGVSLGVTLGVTLDNLSLWMPIGISFGLCVGSALDAGNRKKAERGNVPQDPEVSDYEET